MRKSIVCIINNVCGTREFISSVGQQCRC